MQISKKGVFTFMALMAMSMGLLTSCDKENDPDKGGENVTQTDTSGFDGTHLIAVDKGNTTKFKYNTDGSLHQILNGTEVITFDYKSGTIKYSDADYEEKVHFKTNKKGYITEASSSESDEDGAWTVVFKFQYNSSDHLINIAANEVYTDNDTKETETSEINGNLVWNGDLLSSIEVSLNEGEEQMIISSKLRYTDAVDNRYKQYTSEIINTLGFDGGLEDFMYVGLLGKGASNYPSKIERNFAGIKFIMSIDYELNSKGLVDRENITTNFDMAEKYNTTSYSYDNITKASAPAADNNIGRDKKSRMNNRNHITLFGRRK